MKLVDMNKIRFMVVGEVVTYSQEYIELESIPDNRIRIGHIKGFLVNEFDDLMIVVDWADRDLISEELLLEHVETLTSKMIRELDIADYQN